MPTAKEIVLEAIDIIQAEHDQMVSSFTVRSPGDAEYGKVVDRAAKRDIDTMARWLRKARKFVE